jgi:hypothetical protein
MAGICDSEPFLKLKCGENPLQSGMYFFERSLDGTNMLRVRRDLNKLRGKRCGSSCDTCYEDVD